MRRRQGKPKRVNYELIPRESVIGHPMYALLDELVEAHHASDLRVARIALAWCTSWKPDVDGRVTIGKCKKASDLDREIAEFDFVILLSRGFWRDDRVSDAQRAALLDHELCHAARKYDDRGEPVEDERGRPVFRVRKHDVEEFTAIITRHGCYKADLEDFAAAIRRSHLTDPFEPCEECKDSPGWIRITEGNVQRAKRCRCWVAWSEKRNDARAESAAARTA